MTVQDSEEGSSFTNTSLTFNEAVGTPDTTRFIFVHPNKVRRFVRLRVDTNGGTLTGGGVTAVALTPSNGVLPSVTYTLDSGA